MTLSYARAEGERQQQLQSVWGELKANNYSFRKLQQSNPTGAELIANEMGAMAIGVIGGVGNSSALLKGAERFLKEASGNVQLANKMLSVAEKVGLERLSIEASPHAIRQSLSRNNRGITPDTLIDVLKNGELLQYSKTGVPALVKDNLVVPLARYNPKTGFGVAKQFLLKLPLGLRDYFYLFNFFNHYQLC